MGLASCLRIVESPTAIRGGRILASGAFGSVHLFAQKKSWSSMTYVFLIEKNAPVKK